MNAPVPASRQSHWLSVALLVWAVACCTYFLPRPTVLPLWTTTFASLPHVLTRAWLAALLSPSQETATGLAQCALLVLYLLAWGWFAPTRLWPDAGRLERLAAGAWLATASLAFGFMVLGTFHLLRPGWGWVWMAVHAGALAAARRIPPSPLIKGGNIPPHRSHPSHRSHSSSLPMWVAIGLLSLLTFYHALLYPPTSWDALMYYLEYPRESVLHGGFPTVVCSQVGMGLAANYPPLYRALAAGIPSLTGEWNPLVGQFANPWAGLLATLLVYAWLRRRGLDALCASAGTLAFRALPYGLVFSMQPGHYAWTMAAVAAFLWASERALARRDAASLLAALLFAATGVSINYLMLALLVPAALLVYVLRDTLRQAPRMRLAAWTGLLLAIAAFWYTRNWIVAGNPVYPFFASILGGRNINPEVLASAAVEWTRNGDGLAGYGSVWQRILHLPLYLLWEPNIIWKLQPIVMVFALPGLVCALVRSSNFSLDSHKLKLVLQTRLWLSLFVVVAGYGLTLGAYYLYHLLPIFPLVGLFAAATLAACTPRFRSAMLMVLLLISLGPSLGAGLIGPHVGSPDLWAFGHPNPPLDEFLSRCPTIDGTAKLWRYFADMAPDAVVLTDENRAYYLPPTLRLLNLDDPAIWPLYDVDDPAAEHARFVALGATHYLYIHNQDKHPILSHLSLGDAAKGKLPQFYRLVAVAANGDALFEIRK